MRISHFSGTEPSLVAGSASILLRAAGCRQNQHAGGVRYRPLITLSPHRCAERGPSGGGNEALEDQSGREKQEQEKPAEEGPAGHGQEIDEHDAGEQAGDGSADLGRA